MYFSYLCRSKKTPKHLFFFSPLKDSRVAYVQISASVWLPFSYLLNFNTVISLLAEQPGPKSTEQILNCFNKLTFVYHLWK